MPPLSKPYPHDSSDTHVHPRLSASPSPRVCTPPWRIYSGDGTSSPPVNLPDPAGGHRWDAATLHPHSYWGWHQTGRWYTGETDGRKSAPCCLTL